MSRVKFFVMALLGVVASLPASNVFAQDCCPDNGGARSNRVRIFSRIRSNRDTYTNNNCCPAPAPCCATPVQSPCCATPAPAPCCQTACCNNQCDAPVANNCNNCGRTPLVQFRRNNDRYTSHTVNHGSYCGCSQPSVSTGCSSCGGCATQGCPGCSSGQIIQGSSQGIVMPEASGIQVVPAPEAPTPAPAVEAPKASSDT